MYRNMYQRETKKKKNKASCAYNHVQPKLNLWPLMSTANNEISCIYYQVMKQDVKRQKLTQLKEASSLWFPQAATCLASPKSALLGLLFFPPPSRLSPTFLFLHSSHLLSVFFPAHSPIFCVPSSRHHQLDFGVVR